MSKMNKTQTLNLVTATVNDLLEANASMLKKDQAPVLAELLTTALAAVIGPKTGGGVSDKVNENGEVYCNYFDTYLPADAFNTKTNGKYKANSVEAEKIIRKIKTLKAAAVRGLTAALRAGTMDETAYFEAMDAIDLKAAKQYTDVNEVNTDWA